MEGLVDVKVIPLLGGCLSKADKLVFLLGLLEVFVWYAVLVKVAEILLSGNQVDRSLSFDFAHFGLPLFNVSNRGWLVHSAAQKEQIGVFVHDLAIGAQVVVSARVVNLELDLLFLDTFGASVNIKHSWLVVLCELIV